MRRLLLTALILVTGVSGYSAAQGALATIRRLAAGMPSPDVLLGIGRTVGFGILACVTGLLALLMLFPLRAVADREGDRTTGETSDADADREQGGRG